MNTFNTCKRFSNLTAIAGLLVISSALAGSPSREPPQVTVNYQELNLSTTAGAKVLYQRIKRAARAVCAPLQDRQAQWRDCYGSAIADAVAEIDRPMLTALHRSATRTTS
jgi:UrcA family protein